MFAFSIFAWAVLAARISELSVRSPYSAAAVIASIAIFPLWDEQMADECYIYNYPMATALALYIITLYLRPEGHRPPALALWGAAMSWWHEGFGLPLLVATAAVTSLWRDDTHRRQRLWLTAGLALGLTVVAVTPGTYARTAQEFAFSTSKLTALLPGYTSTAAFLLLAAATAAVRQLRRACSWRLLTLLAICALTVAVINIRFQYARVGWMAPICSSIGILYIINLVYRQFLGGVRFGRHLLKAAVAIVAAAVSAKVCIGAAGAYRLRGYMQSMYAAGASIPQPQPGDRPVIFASVASPFDSPDIAVAWPYYEYAVWSGWASGIACEYTHGVKAAYLVLPDELEYATGKTGESVDWTPGLRRIGNHFFYATGDFPGSESRSWVTVQVRFGRQTRRMAMSLMPFVSKADGRTYHYIRPVKVGRLVPPGPVTDMEILSWHTPDGTAYIPQQ